ncbi:MAG TPA: hypothetical protein VE487_11100, partial [Ilumatobacter sp.]|nr:hypothetical protein [Ilumatobacter sp.]
DGVKRIPSALKQSANGPTSESSCLQTVELTSGAVLLLVIVIDAATAVCPTITVAGNVGLTDRPAPALTIPAGDRTALDTTTITASVTVHLPRMPYRPIAIYPRSLTYDRL